MDGSLSSAIFQSDRYKPSVKDVLEVKQFLFEHGLAAELVDAIIDYAEYWPHSSSVIGYEHTPLVIKAGTERENQFILRSWPLGYDPSTDTKDPHNIPWPFISKPWPASQDIPDEATEELLQRLTSASLPRTKHPCRKIVFKLKSHDQGWGGTHSNKGTYRGSYAWFDTGLERISASRESIPQLTQIPLDREDSTGTTRVCFRTISPNTVLTPSHTPEKPVYDFEHPLIPSRHTLQQNVVASYNTKEHVITWSYDDNILPDSLDGNKLEENGRGRETGTGEYVRNLEVGDVVTVWAKARFPGWAITVEDVQVDVYWAV